MLERSGGKESLPVVLKIWLTTLVRKFTVKIFISYFP
jgi:hypothetical protein